jgi:predicted nucleic acid-binding protein
MSDSHRNVVCDAGPIIHLDELGCLSLLDDFEVVLVPEHIWREVKRHRPDALSRSEITLEKTSITISTAPAFTALVKTLSLDLGEQAAISLMEQQPQALFLTDDTAARLAAVTLGFKVHGTIGIVVRAMRCEQLTKQEVLSLLRNLPDRSTLHIRPSLLQRVIDRLK